MTKTNLDILPPLDKQGWPISQTFVARLSTDIPGLGNSNFLMDFYSNQMITTSNNNKIVGSFHLCLLGI